MTPIEAVRAGNRDAALTALAGLSAHERRKLSTELFDYYEVVHDGESKRDRAQP